MKQTSSEARFFVPPPGPLSWLFPELVPLSSLPVGRAVSDLRRSGAGRISIEDGPRGHTLWTRLCQVTRNSGVELCPPSPDPPSWSGGGNSVPLESLLTAAADGAAEGDAVQVSSGPGEEFRFETVALGAIDQGATSVFLLPLRPGRGLERSLKHALGEVSKNIVPLRHAGLVPYFVTSPEAGSDEGGGTGPVETRLPPSWWGVLPGDRYPRTVRELHRQLMRLLHPDRMFLFLALENYALAGIDLYAETLMGRFEGSTAPGNAPAAVSPGRAHRAGKPLVIGVCGIDGSGKSSHVAALERYLKGRGLRTSVLKMYRHGVFHDTVTDLTRQCAGGRNLHLWRIQRLAKAFDSVKYFYSVVEDELAVCDAVIFDRYLYTHFAAGAGRYHHDPFTRELLAVYPPAHRIYLLDAPTELALRRIGARDAKTVDENPYMLSRYRHALLDLGRRHEFMVLDSRASFEENSRMILDDAARLVESRSGTP